jgi:mono/diheme cytochrome c family protein
VFVLTGSAQSVPDGQSLYTEHCSACHGATAEGGSAPDLTNPRWHSQISDEQLASVIRDGVPGRAMPAFAAALDAPSRAAVVGHLRDLSKKAVRPTTDANAPRVQVSGKRLLEATDDTDNWLMYGRIEIISSRQESS